MQDIKYVVSQDLDKRTILLNQTVYRIQALKDFADVKARDFGGYISEEHNLSYSGDCWVYDDSIVYNKAVITGDAVIKQGSEIYGHAIVGENAR